MTDDVRIDRWVQDTVDLIEFANGSVDTEWGAKRAALGHPEPFGLKYIGLGNEENTRTFEANFPRFRDAVEAAHPEVTVISNSGPDDTGARFDELWKFNREQGVAMVDEHYYNDPSWFLSNTERYDSYDREGPHVFLGEYASRGNAWSNALSEAAYMTGIERNADLVELASYAPMFANEDHVQWSPDMMWFDNDESWGSTSYYTQKMFMTNTGDQVVPSTHDGPEETPADISGGVFLSTWNTRAAYDDVKVTDNETGEVLFSDSFEDGSGWDPQAGTWAVADGEYVQSAADVTDARSIITDAYTKDWDNYTLELDARKLGGSEAFLVGFGAGGRDDFYWWNLGGWNNTRQALQRADGGPAGEVAAVERHSLETGRDYHVKVVVSGRTIELYLDGELQMKYTEPTTESLYQVVTRDAETGELVLKVVNPFESVARTAVTVDGYEVDRSAEVIEMSGAPSAMNTKAQPERIVPVEGTTTLDVSRSDGDSGFSYDFPAHSITFLRLKESTGS
jgi:alpha-L-arabinofuranosidase